MRPLNKINSAFVTTIGTTDSLSFTLHLIDNVGSYCMLCEKSIAAHEVIHHRLFAEMPESITQNDLNHALIVCSECHSYRDEIQLNAENIDKYLWPDLDSSFSINTQSPIIYSKKKVRYIVESSTGTVSDDVRDMVIVEPNSAAENLLQSKAQNTIDLYKLNTRHHIAEENIIRIPLEDELVLTDHRIRERNFAWDAAENAANRLLAVLDNVKNQPKILDIFHKQITMTAQAKGNWSVWMTVFWNKFKDSELLRKIFIEPRNDEKPELGIIKHFNGTHVERILW